MTWERALISEFAADQNWSCGEVLLSKILIPGSGLHARGANRAFPTTCMASACSAIYMESNRHADSSSSRPSALSFAHNGEMRRQVAWFHETSVATQTPISFR